MESRAASEETTTSSTDFYRSSDQDRSPGTGAGSAPKECIAQKRKRGSLDDAAALEKRRRVSVSGAEPPVANPPSCARLPPEIWQAVFQHLRPEALGRLLRIKPFNIYLTKVQAPPSYKSHNGRLQLLSSESIWAAVRKANHPSLPKPLAGLTELEMWRLLKGRDCQFCKKLGKARAGPDGIWEAGPGANGVKIIWQFGIRCCGKCLNERTEKDTSLFLSAASALLPALPFAFVSKDSHVIPNTVIQEHPSIPPNITITKRYFTKHISQIQEQLKEVRSLGSAAAEEWFKGLEEMGKERLNDAARWERWENKMRHNQPSQKPSEEQPTCSSPCSSNPPGASYAYPAPSNPLAGVSAFSGASTQPLPPRPTAPFQPTYPPPPSAQPPFHQTRPERNIRDVNEAKAARRAEIERRCQTLDPPIPPNVLKRMESFQAAIQIGTPMTDAAWEVLKPRLLSQRAAAERIESEQAAQLASLKAKFEGQRKQDASSREVKEILDREWEEAQKPIRERLRMYADEVIERDWANGDAISKDNCSKFATDVLLRVRKRFYTEQDEINLAPGKDTGLVSVKHSPPRLVLENMKWVFDNKIKPLTEQYRKELFLCNGSGCEGNFKYYGFEGVIQHYGAKHTNAFSVGNIVVHWKEAEWPKEPPFHPDPTNAKAAYFSSSVPGLSHPSQAGYAHFPSGGYSRGASATPFLAVAPHPLSHASPGPYGPNQFPSHATGPFAPPSVPPPVTTAYPVTAGYQAPQPVYCQAPSGFIAYQGSPHPAYMNPPQPFEGYNPPPAVIPQMPGPSLPVQGFSAPPGVAEPSLFYSASGAMPAVQAPHDAQSSAQPILSSNSVNVSARQASGLFFSPEEVDELGAVSKTLWIKTNGIKDLPQSVRVHVLLHHVISSFAARFRNEPSLDLLIHTLKVDASIRHIRSAHGLTCNACASDAHKERSGSSSLYSRAVERKTFTLLTLAEHFQNVHLHRNEAPLAPTSQTASSQLDWKTDMVELPGEDVIADIIHSHGMNDEKLKVFAQVFPHLFPESLQPASLPSHPAAHSGQQVHRRVQSMLSHAPQPPRSVNLPYIDPARNGVTPTLSSGNSGPPSHDSPMGQSPQLPPEKFEEEYEPLPPRYAGHSRRQPSEHWLPQYEERRGRFYYEEPTYLVPRRLYEDELRDHIQYYAQADSQSPALGESAPHEAGDGRKKPSPTFDTESGSETRGARDLSFAGHPSASDPLLRPCLREARYSPDNVYVKRELSEGPQTRSQSTLAPLVVPDADRFLNDLMLENANMAKGKAAEQQRQIEASQAQSAREGMTAESQSRALASHPERLPQGDSGEPAIGRSSLQATPAPPPEDALIRGPEGSLPPGTQREDRMDTSRETISRRKYSHSNRRYVEAMPHNRRYARYYRVYREEIQGHGQRTSRSRSNWERYEAQRRRLDRERSHSPHHQGDTELEYRSRSPGRAYTGTLHHTYQDEPPSDGQRRPPPAPPVTRYTYADAAHPQLAEYSEPVRLVRVHEPYPRERYVVGMSEEADRFVEYVPYERGPPPEPVYQDRQYYYYSERPPAPSSGPYETEPERRVYDSESAPVPPGREVRYVEQSR